MRIPIVPPIEAYRLDLERTPDATHDPAVAAVWVTIGSYFDVVANASSDLHTVLVTEGERIMSIAFDALHDAPFPLPETHPYYWADAIREALAPMPTSPNPGRVIDTVIRMAGAIEAAGFPLLAFSTMDAAGSAFPPDDPREIARLFMCLGGLAERLGGVEQARDSYADAALYAGEAQASDLLREAERGIQRMRRKQMRVE
jgi:hypothetical protein